MQSYNLQVSEFSTRPEAAIAFCGRVNDAQNRQSAPQPGISGWARMSTPPAMAIGPAQAATVFDGTNYIILTANWRAGLWRFVE